MRAKSIRLIFVILFGVSFGSLIAVLILPSREAKEKKLSYELKIFALEYHRYYDLHNVGPSKLEDLDITHFPNVAERIRTGSIVVIWWVRLRGSAEENGKYWLAHESKVTELGGWVLLADGQTVKISSAEFQGLPPIPSF